jgi:hypothetical protein
MSSVLLIAEPSDLRSKMVEAIQLDLDKPLLLADPHSPALAQQIASANIVVPLTWDLPTDLTFPGSSILAACRQIDALRDWVQQYQGCPTGEASFWLPLILTAKGIHYGEAIAICDTNPPSYQQPLHLTDGQRQPLYQLGWRLLQHLQATPSLYLLGCTYHYQGSGLLFDRLLPFPTEAVLSSCQQPDLLTCHWLCLNHQPILEINIPSTATFSVTSA